MTILFLTLVVLPSAVLSIVSLVAIRTEHRQTLTAERNRLEAASRRLAAALSLRLGDPDRRLARELQRAVSQGERLDGIGALVRLLAAEGYRRFWLFDAQEKLVGSGAQGLAPQAKEPSLPEPLRERLDEWLRSDSVSSQQYVSVSEDQAFAGKRLFVGMRLSRAAAGAVPLGVACFEVDLERRLAREAEALIGLVAEREQARFAIVPIKRQSPSSFVNVDGGNGPAAAQTSLVRYRLSPPFDHLALEVGALDTAPNGALETLSKRLHVWAIVFILSGLLVGASVTTLAVHREMKTAALKSDFVTTVTHELKTPLTSIGMFAETLLMGRVHDEAERRECLEIIARETERLSRLIDRVLTFSKIEAQKKRFDLRLTDLRALVEETVDLFRTQMRTAPEPVEIEVVELADLPPVLCDRAALQEVLLNLFSNAYKYSRWRRSDPGTSSSGESSDGEPGEVRPRRIQVTVTKRRRWAMIGVRDWGVGISRSEQRKIFRKFYRANDVLTRDVEGSGIGLSLARSIMRAHRGDITVRSRLGQGSTFTLWLPR